MLIPNIIALDVVQPTISAPQPIMFLLILFVASVIIEGLVLTMFKYENFGRSMMGSFLVNLLSTGLVAGIMFTEVVSMDTQLGSITFAGAIIGFEAIFMMIMKGKFKAGKALLVSIVMNVITLGALAGGGYLVETYL